MMSKSDVFCMMKNENLKLRGTRLYLRYPIIEDCAEFIASAKSSEKFHRNLVNPAKDEESFRSFVERNRAKENEFLLICLNSDERIIGAVNLSQIFRLGFQNCYLGYYLFVDFIGKRLMSEAVGLILRHAFNNLKLHRERDTEREQVGTNRTYADDEGGEEENIFDRGCEFLFPACVG